MNLIGTLFGTLRHPFREAGLIECGLLPQVVDGTTFAVLGRLLLP